MKVRFDEATELATKLFQIRQRIKLLKEAEQEAKAALTKLWGPMPDAPETKIAGSYQVSCSPRRKSSCEAENLAAWLREKGLGKDVYLAALNIKVSIPKLRKLVKDKVVPVDVTEIVDVAEPTYVWKVEEL